MLNKVGDVTAPINHFIDPVTGKQKTFYRTVGALLENDSGELIISLSQDFNLLGCIHDNTKGSVFLPIKSESVKRPEKHSKPLKTKVKQSHTEKKQSRPTKAQVDAAKQLLAVDSRARETKKAGHILPFDGEPFNDEILF